MNIHDERDMIVDYVINSKNVELALKIGASFDKIRERIIVVFLKNLETALKDRLNNDWAIENSLIKNVFDHWRRISIAKKNWNDKYNIGISSEKHGARGFIIGILKGNEKQEIIKDDILRKALDNYKKGLQSPYWEWYINCEGHFKDWDNEEVLLSMHKYDGKSDIYFMNEIMNIKDIAEPIIDKYLGI